MRLDDDASRILQVRPLFVNLTASGASPAHVRKRVTAALERHFPSTKGKVSTGSRADAGLQAKWSLVSLSDETFQKIEDIWKDIRCVRFCLTSE